MASLINDDNIMYCKNVFLIFIQYIKITWFFHIMTNINFQKHTFFIFFITDFFILKQLLIFSFLSSSLFSFFSLLNSLFWFWSWQLFKKKVNEIYNRNYQKFAKIQAHFLKIWKNDFKKVNKQNHNINNQKFSSLFQIFQIFQFQYLKI